MSTQLGEQSGKQEDIESTLTTQIDTQAEELKKQVEAYKEQTKVKHEEEKQMINVLKEYKAKFQEFQQATKFSKQNQKKFQKEVTQLDKRKKNLEVDYHSLQTELNITSEPDADINDLLQSKLVEVDSMEQEWAAEKERMLAQVNSIKEECAQLQQQIADKSNGGAAAASQ